MSPVWLIFSRRNVSRLAYWLSALGYNLRDQSGSNRVYLVYFVVFWMIWVGAVFVMFGSQVAVAFTLLGLADPLRTVISFGTVVMSGWGVMQLWQAVRRSPLMFQEEDAYLLCQTPVERRTVGVAWFVQSWVGAMLPFAAASVILAFGLVEWQLQGDVTILKLGEYLRASGRAMGVVLLLQLAIMIGVWSVGTWRLQGKAEPRGLRGLAWGVGLVWLGAVIGQGWLGMALIPVSVPLAGAFGAAGVSWGWALGLCGVYLAGGIFFFIRNTARMNLSRAAQETTLRTMLQTARSQGQYGLVEAVELRQRLGAAHKPSRMPGLKGAWLLVWKDAVQTWRARNFAQVGRWAWLFSLNLSAFLVPDGILRLVFWGLWTVSLGGMATQRLRNDLARWWILRALPFSHQEILLAEMGVASGVAVVCGWLALFVSGPTWEMGVWVVLVPLLVVNVALGAMQDILRQSKARALLSPSIAEENVPQQHLSGILPGLIVVLGVVGLLQWGQGLASLPMLSLGVIALAGVAIFYNLLGAEAAFRWLE
ncbi:MAG: hypothetical protein H6636_05130 [Anaerolineales bacterium]|nr:hypothetical protein [Anaerolineales bacterium]